MASNEITAGAQNVSPGTVSAQRGDQFGATVTSNLFGPDLYEWLQLGCVFNYRTALAGVTLVVPASGAQTVASIWNPSNSGIVFVPKIVEFGFLSGTTLAGALGIATQTNMGSAIGTGAPVVSYTAIAAMGANVGLATQHTSAVVFATTINLTAASTFVRPLVTVGASATFVNGNVLSVPVNGIAFQPGTLMQVTGSLASQAGVYQVNIVGIEIPIPTGA